MPRAIRINAPGQGIHITARVQNGAPLFIEELRDSIATYICDAARCSGTSVLALAVMPNHFHIVVKQGSFPLGWMMQRAMQRTVCLVRRRFRDGEGHVFGRRFWSSVCSGPMYLRQAIVYTHLNPWKAKLCDASGNYAWSSQSSFYGGPINAEWYSMLAVDKARQLFAENDDDPAATIANYERFEEYSKVRWLQVTGKRLFDLTDDVLRPHARRGDQNCAIEFGRNMPHAQRAIVQRDIRDYAVEVLRLNHPDVTLDFLRSAGRSRGLSQIRRNVIAALLTAGYRGCAIARLLFVSQALVSDVARQLTLYARFA
jgi:REP element-mobilizing transposase RayT